MATTTYTWIDGTSGDWGTAADWSPAGVPDATSDASFVGSGAGTVTVSSDEAVNQLTLDNAGTTLVVQHNATLSIYGGLVATAGSLDLIGNSGQAVVDVLAPAGFGTLGVVTANIFLGDGSQPSNVLVEFSSGQITDIAQYGSLVLWGPNAIVADAGSLSSNSALQGLSSIEGTFELLGGGTLQTTGSLTNSGIFWADVDYFNNGSSGTVTIGGTVTNSGAFSVSDGTTVSASGFDNIGNLQVASSFGEQAKLDIAAPAGFGATGVLTGHVQLEGNAVVEFASGQITDIASGALLEVGSPDAFVQDASSPGSNSALQGLSAIEGALALFGATVQTTGDLANSGALTLQNANLSIGGTLTNSGQVTDGGQAPGGTVSAAGLDNQSTGTIVVAGAPGQLAALDISGAATNDGTLTAQFATVDLQGPVSGSGTATIDYGGSIEFGSSVASTESVIFNSDGSFAHTLIIDQPDQFFGVISGFGTSSLGDDIIELANAQAASATPIGFSDGVTTLEVKDAAANVIATLRLSGDYTGYTFDIANGGTGSGITTNAAPPSIDDTPALTVPGAQTVVVGNALELFGSGKAVSLSDPDASTFGETFTFKISHAASNGAGFTILPEGATVTGSGTDIVTVTGTLAQVNAALTTLDYASNNPGVQPGTDTITFQVTDSDGGSDTKTIAVNLVSSTAGPQVTERLANDTGTSSTDKITSNDTLSGSGDPNATVHFTVDGTPLQQTATADASGAWTFTPAGLSDGSHTVVANETDTAGNPGTASLTFTQDTISPNLVSLDRADPAGPTNAGQVLYSVTFSEPVTGVDASQFRVDPASTVSGASIAAVTAIDATHYSVAVNTGTGDGTVGIELIGTGIYDLAGNPLAGGQFKPQIALATGSAPTFPVISDVNGDGKVDIVVSDLNAGTISVRLGNGDGSFQSDHPYAASAYSVAVGDVSGDGKADLVTADPGGGASVLLGNGDGTFQSQLHFAAGGNDETVVIGDLNNDGKADLILADNWGGVTTLLGNGNGSFQPYAQIATGGSTTSVAVGDLNGDGKLDIVSSNFGSGDIAVLLGKGDGTFQPQAHYGSGNQPNGVHLADLNGDGHLDLVFVNEGSGTVSVLLGNGDGTFQAETNYAAGAGARWVSIADLNGDGKLDLAVANQGSNNVSVLFGNGDGTFRSQVNYAAGTQPFGIAAGDLDGDGRADLVVANLGSNSVSFLFNTPPAIPGPAYAIDKTAPAVTESLAVDTGLSSTDKLTKNDTLKGSGDPNAVVHFTVDGSPIAETTTAAASGTWTFTPAGLADGSHTIVASETDAAGNTGSPSVTFTLDTSDPAVSGIAQTNAAPTNASTVDYIVSFSEAVTGVDASQFAIDPTSTVSGASIAGVIAIDASHYKVTVSTGTGDGTVALDVIGAGIHDLAGNPLQGGKLVPQGAYGTGAGPISVAIGDVNGDGKPDLVVANGNSFSTASVLLGNGDGTFQPQITVNTGTSHQLVLGDVNGDGKLDIVSANSHDGTVPVLLGNGDGTFQPKTDYAAGANAISVAVADVNGDGKLDIATANYGANTDSILLGNGDGTFQPQTAYATGVQPGITVAADVNSDGRPDLITINQVSNTVSVLLGNGDGTFQPQTTYATQSGPADVIVADVNGDGKLDLVTANIAAKNVSVLLGNGDGTFQPQTAYAVGDSPFSLASGDINGDGKPDIVATALNANTFSVLMGNGDGTFQPQVTYATGAEPLWVAIGDVSGDGRPDLLVTNGGSNNVSVFLNSPPAIAGPAYAIDKTGPAVTESLANDTGVSSTDKLTKSDALSGTGDPNAVVHFTVDGSPVAQTATADASGAWAFTPPALADGSHTIVASDTDAAGNVGSASLTFALDTHGPTGWTFTLASSNFDGSNSIASGTVIGSVGATGDPNNSSFTYFFASNQSGAGATQNLNGLFINASTGAINTTAALSSWPTAWVIAEDQAGNIFAKQLVLSFGTSSANTINVAAGTAAIFALGGSDTITGTPANDGIAAGAGNDTIVGFVGTDTVNGGAGTDTISLAATSADLNAASDARIVNVETISAAQAASGVTIDLHNQTEGFTINGSASGDVIVGTAAADTISAGAGNDTIMGFVGADTVHGGTGTDTIALTATSTSLNSALDTQIVNVEAVSAAAAASGVSINLHNQSEGFTIVGSSSADAIVGTSAKDTIDGGAGADTLTGGAGKDTFVFINKLNSLVSAYDTITDFVHGSDMIEIGHTVSASNFSALSHASTGNLLADLNATLTTANLKSNGADMVTLTGTGADAGTYVIVNSGHGSGYLATADAVIKLQAGATVTAADFIA